MHVLNSLLKILKQKPKVVYLPETDIINICIVRNKYNENDFFLYYLNISFLFVLKKAYLFLIIEKV